MNIKWVSGKTLSEYDKNSISTMIEKEIDHYQNGQHSYELYEKENDTFTVRISRRVNRIQGGNRYIHDYYTFVTVD